MKLAPTAGDDDGDDDDEKMDGTSLIRGRP